MHICKNFFFTLYSMYNIYVYAHIYIYAREREKNLNNDKEFFSLSDLSFACHNSMRMSNGFILSRDNLLKGYMYVLI